MAWDIENKSMWDWEEIQSFWESEGYFPGIFDADHWIPLQFTRLHDKNGKEIYEGHILANGEDVIGEVKFHTKGIGSCGCCYPKFSGSGFFAFTSRGCDIYMAYDVVVVGNIYENPDLIQNHREIA
jgi:uncharacterized phage protein (TIGR01671 family)